MRIDEGRIQPDEEMMMMMKWMRMLMMRLRGMRMQAMRVRRIQLRIEMVMVLVVLAVTTMPGMMGVTLLVGTTRMAVMRRVLEVVRCTMPEMVRRKMRMRGVRGSET